MRLSCPNCGAQYEVPVEVIPQDGRDVQCSNCGHTWFQMHPDQDAELATEVGGSIPDEGWDPNVDDAEDPAASDETREVQPPEPVFDDESDDDEALEEAADLPPEPEQDYVDPDAFEDDDLDEDFAATDSEPEIGPELPEADEEDFEEDAPDDEAPAEPRQPRKAIDPAIADLLREEAEYEAKARAAESRETLETQTEMGLEAPAPQLDKRADEARRRMRRIRGLSEEAEETPTNPDTASEAALDEAAHASRRELLPDIDEINSTLRSADDRGDTDTAAVAAATRRREKSGFRLGFGFVMLFAALVIMAYVYNKEIVAAYPASEPYVMSFMETMNNVRVWLDTKVTQAMLWLDNIAESAGGNVD